MSDSIKIMQNLSAQNLTQRKHNGYNNALHTHLQQKCQTSTKLRTIRDSSLSLSLSRKIASAVSALALSILASTTFTLQAQTPQSTDEKIKQLEKELRLLELQKQIDQAKKEQSSDKTADKATDKSSTTSTTQSAQTTQNEQIIQNSAPQKPKRYDYGYDRSGFFMGAELGYGELLSTVSTNLGVLKEKDDGFKYGLLLGFNDFFVKYFGIRYYANVNVTQFSDKRSSDMVFRLNYGANLDAIANFLATDYADFGAFVGLGVGGQTYFFTGQNGADLDKLESMGVKVSYTSFDVGLNVGLRTNIAEHFGIELAARVPFIKHNLFEAEGAYVLKETYSISARLLWNF